MKKQNTRVQRPLENSAWQAETVDQLTILSLPGKRWDFEKQHKKDMVWAVSFPRGNFSANGEDQCMICSLGFISCSVC